MTFFTRLRFDKSFFLCFSILLLLSTTSKAQNFGFEAVSATPPTNWTPVTLTWSNNTDLNYVRTGLKSMTVTDPATSGSTIGNTSGYITTTTAGNYLITIMWGKSNTASNAAVIPGYRTGTTNTLNPSATTTPTSAYWLNSTTWTRVTSVSAATVAAGSYGPALRAFRVASTTGTIIYMDDFITYASTSNIPDLTAPNSATNVFFTGNTINWLNGSDNGAPASGIGGVVIVRTNGSGIAAPTLNDQAMYSLTTGASGTSSFDQNGNTWTVVGNIGDNTTNTFTDNTAGAGPYTYAVFMRDMAYNYSAGIAAIPSSPCTSPATPGVSNVSPSTIECAGTSRLLTLSGNSQGTGQTYVWQSSSTLTGVYTDISTSSTSTSLTVNPTVTTYYRTAVTCGSSTTYSTPVAALVNPAMVGGTYTINNSVATGGTNFQTFSDAFNAISCGVSGTLIFNVSAGQTFNENPPVLNATGTSSSTITFQKFGTGSNPVINVNNPGTIASSTTLGANGDAIITINGGDYITFDGIDLTSSYSNAAEMYEYGYYLKKKSGTDGCKNVTIKNCAITLNKTALYSFGIFASNNSSTTSDITVTTTAGRNENIKIFNNTITGCYGGILVRGYAASVVPYDLYDQNIEIGVDGSNTISDFGGGATESYGIYAIYQNNLKVANNIITSATSGHAAILYGINANTGLNATATIYNNTITITGGGTTQSIYALYSTIGGTGTSNTVSIYNNTITGCTYPTATTGSMYLLYIGGTVYKVDAYGNKLINNTHTPSTTGAMYGLYQIGSTVNEVKLHDNFISGNAKSTGTTGVIYWLYNNTVGTATSYIYNDTVTNNTSTGTTGIMYGIYQANGLANYIYKNTINGLTATATTTGGVYGIAAVSGTANSIYNNFISDLNAPTTIGTEDGVRGLSLTSTTTTTSVNAYFNTIYLSATSSGANFSTSGIYHTASTTTSTDSLTMKNNIVVNISTPNGTGYSAAIKRSSGAANMLNNFAKSSNNNLLYVGTPSSNQVIFYDGTNSDQTISSYKARVTPRESGSISENPSFINIVALPFNLHINTATPTQIESGGIAVTGITDDFDGNTRNVSTPDIGADEFNGVGADLTGPSINYTSLPTSTICTDAKTIVATITDASNINVAAGTKPRLWYKKETNADVLPASNTSAGNGWKWVESTSSSSPFTFVFDNSLLTSSLTGGDSVSYFIVAQDIATTPNVGVNDAIFNTTPATVALSAASFPLSGNIKGFRILSIPSPIPVKATSTELCSSGIVTLSLDGVDATGGTYQWQSTHHSTNNWVDILNATTIPYTTATITDSTDFRLVVKCGGTPIASSPSNIISVNVNNPHIASTTPATRCGTGTVTLAATAPGLDIKWYASATADTTIGIGSPFTTPTINNTTTYYVAAATPGAGAGTTSIGPGATTSATYSASFYSLWSNLHNQHLILASELAAANIPAGKITALALDVTVAGTLPMLDLSVKMANSSATTMASYTTEPFTTVYTAASLMPIVGLNTLNFSTPFVWDGSSNVVIEICHGNPASTATMARTVKMDATSYISTIHTHKTASTGGSSQCTDNLTNLTTYSTRPQFTFTYSTGCIGTRTAVLANVTTAAALTVTSNKTICNNSVDSLVVTSSPTDYNSFVWTPTNDLFTDFACTVPYTGTNALKVYVKSTTPGKTGYKCIANNTTSLCANEAVDTITVMPEPTINASSTELCISGTATLSLTPTSGYDNGSLQWQSSPNGTTYSNISSATTTSYTTPIINTTTYYTMLLKNSTGQSCTTQPIPVMITVNNPTITSTTPNYTCGTGTVNLFATGTGATINWYDVPTGGTAIATGNNFTTPTISTTTNYYATASDGGGVANVGKVGIETNASGTGGGTGSYINFTALSDFTLKTVDIFPYGSVAGTITIELRTSTGTSIMTKLVNVTGSTSTASPAQTVTLDFPITGGASYRLGVTGWTGVTNMFRDDSNISYPYTLPGVVSITSSSLSGYYYFFYNWQVSTGCESARTLVVATVNNNPGCIVPVTLTSFTGERKNNLNVLSWRTATELNNAGFELQRSADGANFSKLSFVNTNAQNGNSSSVLNYQFVDEKPFATSSYYRLKQIDKDGKSTLSNIVVIKGEKVIKLKMVNIYPNPAKDNININLASPKADKITLIVMDITGKIVIRKSATISNGDNNIQLNVQALTQGSYMIKAICADGCETAIKKFVKD